MVSPTQTYNANTLNSSHYLKDLGHASALASDVLRCMGPDEVLLPHGIAWLYRAHLGCVLRKERALSFFEKARSLHSKLYRALAVKG